MNQPPLPRNQVIVSDAHHQLARLPDSSIDMLLTSPPYFQLRNYDVDGQLGLEATVTDWVRDLRRVCRQAHRVLVPSGSLWLNVSDSYATHPGQGAGRKSLLLGPERLALALLADGWVLRNKIVWRKSNPMPTSVRDRLACTWEALYVFVTQPDYYFDLDAIREPHRTTAPRTHRTPPAEQQPCEGWRGANAAGSSGLAALKAAGRVGHPLGKNPGDVWPITSSSYRGAHHATFPIPLASRAIAAGTPEARCSRCRLPWRRTLTRELAGLATRGQLKASCTCQAGTEPGLVLDPFLGVGTTAVAAEQLQRDWLGIELNPGFAALAEQRIASARAGPVRNAA